MKLIFNTQAYIMHIGNSFFFYEIILIRFTMLFFFNAMGNVRWHNHVVAAAVADSAACRCFHCSKETQTETSIIKCVFVIISSCCLFKRKGV